MFILVSYLIHNDPKVNTYLPYLPSSSKVGTLMMTNVEGLGKGRPEHRS